MMRLRITEGSLQALADAVAQERYVTTAADLALIGSLHEEGVMKELGEIAVAPFRQLQAPGTSAPDEPAEGEDEDENEDGGENEDERQKQLKKALNVVTEVRAMFGFPPYTKEELAARGFPPAPGNQPKAGGTPADGARYGVSGQGSQQDAGVTESDAAPDLRPADADRAGGDVKPPLHQLPCAPQPEEAPNPYPDMTEEQWQARETLRRLLANILRRQVELCQAQRVDNLRECVKGPSPYERAAEIAPNHPNARLMQRMDDASFREVWRITNMLMKIQGKGGGARNSRKRRESHDVYDNKTT
jgi:hypothetical protein